MPDDLIPFKSDVLCASKKVAKIESVNPAAVNISIIHYSGIITRVGAFASGSSIYALMLKIIPDNETRAD